jgi:LysR family transcriptional regulator (chromosome initiation inhibitor)
MLNRDQLETFASVIEQGSFDRAAVVLNVTKGAVSQRIKALEDSLSSVLLVRAKPVVPTSSGETLLRHVKMLRLIEEVVLNDLIPKKCDKKAVPIAIAVNADSVATWFSQALWQILETQRIALELVIDDQDHTMERLVKGEVIGCISTKADAMPGFVAEPLGCMEYRCCATPPFAAKHFANGFNLQAVLDAPAVLFNRKDSLHDEFLEKVFGFQVARYVKHYLPAPNTLREAILRGAGYGLLPADQVKSDVETSKLVELIPGQTMAVVLYWHRWEIEPPIFQEMTRVVVHAARSMRMQDSST